MASIKDLKLNPPSKKTDLTKDNMLKYIKTYGSDDDKLWFVNLMKNNKQYKKNNLTGEVVEGYDLSKIREEFAKKFFPSISKEAKDSSKKKSKKLSFEDELNALI